MSNEIAHFKVMSVHDQTTAECSVVDVIYESFVIPGDQDYLMSRLLTQTGLFRGFYWAAAQAIEKYLKAFLLMNGEGVKRFKAHPIQALFEGAIGLDRSLSSIDILPHPRLLLQTHESKYLKRFTVRNYIEELEKHGNADNRYNACGVDYNTGHLFALDSLSFQLRKRIGAPSITESFRHLTQDLILPFGNRNPWFSDSAIEPTQHYNERANFSILDSTSVTKLEFLMKHANNPAYEMALQWLRAKMKVPTTV